jgi:hypothetical protein
MQIILGIAISSSAVVEQMTQNLKFEGSNLASGGTAL